MSTGRMCPTHLSRRSTSTCRSCAKPICDECIQEHGGRFCSPECAAKFQEFQGRVIDQRITRRRRFSLTGCLRTMVISAVLLVVIWVALWQLFDTTDPAQMWTEFQRMLRLAF